MRSLLAACVLAFLAAACAREPAWTWTTPAVVGEGELAAALVPRGDERLVLAHFWATW